MKKWLLLGGLALVVISLALFLPRIKKINCRTQYGQCPNYYVTRINYLVNKSFIFLPKNQEIKNVLSSYPEINSVKLSQQFPNILKMQITLHSPVGIVNNYLIDDGGQVLSAATDSNLPKLSIDSIILPGKKLNTDQIAAVETLNSLIDIFANIENASLSGQILNLSIGTTAVVFDVSSLPKNYSDSLQLIFTRSKVEGTAPKKVDMRFNNPIIVY